MGRSLLKSSVAVPVPKSFNVTQTCIEAVLKKKNQTGQKMGDPTKPQLPIPLEGNNKEKNLESMFRKVYPSKKVIVGTVKDLPKSESDPPPQVLIKTTNSSQPKPLRRQPHEFAIGKGTPDSSGRDVWKPPPSNSPPTPVKLEVQTPLVSYSRTRAITTTDQKSELNL